jgi:hypothetical protein
MRVLAATGDTWGISGPTFLGLYAALAVLAVIATVLARRSLARSPAPAVRLNNPDDVAYLHGGAELTVLTALSAMYVAGLIAASGRQRVQVVGAPVRTRATCSGRSTCQPRSPCPGESYPTRHRSPTHCGASSAG